MAYVDEYIVERSVTSGVPPSYGDWSLWYEAVCIQITQNHGANTNVADLQLQAGTRWNDVTQANMWDRVRIRTPEEALINSTILFEGLITQWTPAWAPQTEIAGFRAEGYEYIMRRCLPIYGQYIYPQSAYTGGYFTAATKTLEVAPTTGTWIHATGRPCVFNQDGKPNRCGWFYDPLVPGATEDDTTFTVPIFGMLDNEMWTVRQMLVYVLEQVRTNLSDWIPGTATAYPDQVVGLAGTDPEWDSELLNVTIEGLSALEAIEYIASLVGWRYRLDIYYDAAAEKTQARHVFYKPGRATTRTRSSDSPVVLDYLYAPDNYKSADNDAVPVQTNTLANLIAWGEPVVQAGNLMFDPGAVANTTIALGSIKEHEITVELVPAWYDGSGEEFGFVQAGLGDLYGFVQSYINTFGTSSAFDLFLSDDEIKAFETADEDVFNSKFVAKRYHRRGSEFATYHDIGRKWALNEVGDYTLIDRGQPFDFASIITGLTAEKFGYSRRAVSAALTAHDAQGDSISYVIEWSNDGGTTWWEMDGSVDILTREFGIYISEPNLAEIKPLSSSAQASGLKYPADLFVSGDGGIEQNYWTALCNDMRLKAIAGNPDGYYVDSTWYTQVRLTATVRLDDRLVSVRNAVNQSRSPFPLIQILDRTNKAGSWRREAASKFSGKADYPLPWWEHKTGNPEYLDNTVTLQTEQNYLATLSGQAMLSGLFELPRIFGRMGNGDWARPRFMVGDCLEEIRGRNISLQTNAGSMGREATYVWIEQIIYKPELQQTTLITADLRQSYRG